MKILCVFTLLLATAYCFSTILEEDWIAYKLKHEKSYPNEAEDRFRKSLFVKTTVEVFKNHLKYYNGSVGHKLEVNAFADVTETEFLRHKCGFMRQKERAESATAQFKFNETLSVPSSVDWRTMGAVTPVKDQKQCGSCWAFSATGALEGQNFIKNKKLISLSEQQMIDCGGKFEPYLGGCDGGLMKSAFDYVKKTNGDSSDLNYPYKAVQNQCQFRASNVAVTCKGYIQVANNENAMMQAVATVGPISVSLSVNGNAGSYSQGIFPLSMCDVQNNHGVLIVGYGTNSKGVNYWIVKNSWGKGWGMGGYFLLQRGIKACGINQDPSYPLV